MKIIEISYGLILNLAESYNKSVGRGFLWLSEHGVSDILFSYLAQWLWPMAHGFGQWLMLWPMAHALANGTMAYGLWFMAISYLGSFELSFFNHKMIISIFFYPFIHRKLYKRI